MAQAKPDDNRKPSAIVVSKILATAIVRLKVNPVNKGVIVELA